MIKIINLSKKYENNLILDNLTATFDAGLIYILGRSGSGKTTLLNILGTLDSPSSGILEIDGVDLSKLSKTEKTTFRKEKIGFIFQDKNLINTLNVYDNIAYPLRLLGVDEETINDRVFDVLNKVLLNGFEEREIKSLSGGEMQKVAIARALVKNPKVILADEITSSLDSINKVEIMKVIENISKDILVIMITHDKMIVNDFKSETYLLENKKLVLLDKYKNQKKAPEEDLNNKTTKNSLIFHIKDSFKYFINHKIKMIITVMLLTFLATLLGFFLTLNSFNLDKQYDRFSNKMDLDYIEFKDIISQKIGDELVDFERLIDEKIEVENTHWGIPFNDVNNDSFNNIIFINNKIDYKFLDGEVPSTNDEIMITDFLSNDVYKGIKIDDQISILGKNYVVSGILKTNYLKHSNPQSELEKLVSVEQTEYLSSIFMYEEEYLKHHKTVMTYKEDIIIEIKNNQQKVNNVKVTSDAKLNKYDVLVSKDLYKLFDENNLNNISIYLTKHKLTNINVNIVGVSENNEFILSEELYKELNNNRFGYIGFTHTNNLSYILNQKYLITNKTVLKPIEINSAIIVINETVLMILIIASILLLMFGFVILYLIFNNDKVIIGIKKSMGVRNSEIFIYYFTIFLIIGIFSAIISSVFANLILYVYDNSFNNYYSYNYLQLNFTNLSFIVLFCISFLNIISIPYLVRYLNKDVIYLIRD